MTETHIALLRGINVGGKNKLAMKDLESIFMGAGATAVRTYIQSGNVLFTACRNVLGDLGDVVVTEIAARHGLRVPVILRSQAEIEAARGVNPFHRRGLNPKALHVMFLRDSPSNSTVLALDPHRSPPDEFAVLGREVFLHCPNGIARSKLTTTWIDRALDTVSTIRNWNTVNALADMCRELP